MPTLLAADLGGTQIRTALSNEHGDILKRYAIPTRAQEGPAAVIERMASALRAVLGDVPLAEVAGIGVSSVGPLNHRTGHVLQPPNLPGWNDIPLRDILAERTGRPVFVGNDANVAALAEAGYGAGRGVRDLIYLTLSTGIGGGVITDGRLLLGRDGMAMEAGHIIVQPDGPQCGCGNRGCLEAVSSGTGIANAAAAELRTGAESVMSAMVAGDLDRINAQVVSDAARQGDALALAVLARAGTYLGIGIADYIYIFNPERIILGGSVTKTGAPLFDPMWSTIRTLVKPHYLAGLEILPAALGDDVGLLGGVALAATELGLL